ncbi:multicopper oxidase family protein [Anaerocolumna sedimenticola]|uniref:multicopper oxidase family protein n=1 Tax=Anaerocolumna sedimenticola TaxID=2696063 RepID=UPI002ED63FC8
MFTSQIRKHHTYAAKMHKAIKNTFHKNNKNSVSVMKLDPAAIPKYVNQLEKPPVYKPYIKAAKNDNVKGIMKESHGTRHLYEIDISEFKQQILPKGYPDTTVWGYGGLIEDRKTGRVKYYRGSPGATLEAVRNIPVTVNWINHLQGSHLFAVDPTLHWANPNHIPMDPPEPWPSYPPGFHDAQKPIPVVTHLHGGEVISVFDGHPDAWFTSNGKTGSAFITNIYTYPNKQDAATLWYHDHALGITRLNLYAGLAGFYLLRNSAHNQKSAAMENKFHLPHGKFEIPLLIQDRSFMEDGSFYFHTTGNNPDIHPYWMPEFFGDTIMVNGKVWPNLNVKRNQYRFRILNGSNARFYNLKLSNGMKMTQIGSDGGFLPTPVVLESLLLAPAERADILIDFSDIKPGTKIMLLNDANAPYPGGNPPDPDTVGQVMRFTVPMYTSPPVKPGKLPDILNKLPELIPDSPKKVLTLFEINGLNGPVELLLDGQKWSSPTSELPVVGSTQIWEIANLTADTHPIHLHLVQFRLLNRQKFKASEYENKWTQINGLPPLDHPTNVLELEPYLIGSPYLPDENEKGWKDTVRMNPNEVTRILVRFAPQRIPSGSVKPGENRYSFDPARGLVIFGTAIY